MNNAMEREKTHESQMNISEKRKSRADYRLAISRLQVNLWSSDAGQHRSI
jgi:hypothetical protein